MADFPTLVAQRMAASRPQFQSSNPQVPAPQMRSIKPGYGSLGQAAGGALGTILGRYLNRKYGLGETREQLYERAIKAADAYQHMPANKAAQLIQDQEHIRKQMMQFALVAPSRYGVAKDAQGREYAYPLRKATTPEIEKEFYLDEKTEGGTKPTVPQDIQESQKAMSLMDQKIKSLQLANKLEEKLLPLKETEAYLKNDVYRKQIDSLIQDVKSSKEAVLASQTDRSIKTQKLPGELRQQTADLQKTEAATQAIQKETTREEILLPYQRDFLIARTKETNQMADYHDAQVRELSGKMSTEDVKQHDTWTQQRKDINDEFSKQGSTMDPMKWATRQIEIINPIIDTQTPMNVIANPVWRQKLDIAFEESWNAWEALGPTSMDNIESKKKILNALWNEKGTGLYNRTFDILRKDGKFKSPELAAYDNKIALSRIQMMQLEIKQIEEGYAASYWGKADLWVDKKKKQIFGE